MAERSPVSPKVVTGVYPDAKLAANAITMLIDAGFDRKKLSVIGTQPDELRKLISPILRSGPDQILVYCAVFGAIIGAVCGWYSMVTVHGAHFFLSTMPLFAALTGSAAGAYVGLFAGGIASADASSSPCAVREIPRSRREILVSVTVISSVLRYNAESLLKEAGAEEVLVAQVFDEHSANAT